MIKTVLFDLDETLLDRDTAVKRYLRDQHSRYNLNHIDYDVYESYFVGVDKRGHADKLKVFGSLVSEFALGCSADELLKDFRSNAWRYCQTFDGAFQTLAQLRERGYQLGIITNGTMEMQDAKLRESKLDSMVDITLVSEREKIKKPDSVIFIRAANRLGIQVSDCIFVGDNPKADIWGAHTAGMKTVWFKGQQSWPTDLGIEPDHEIHSLRELLSINF